MKSLSFIVSVLSICLSMSVLAQTPSGEAQPIGDVTPATVAETADSAEITEPAAVLSQNELMYQVLVAEFAARRGRLDEALEYYSSAALGSQSPEITERATGIALFMKNDALFLELARHWQSLEPDQPQATQTLALALLRNALIDEAVPLLDELIGIEDDEQQAYARLGNLLGQLQERELVLQTVTKILERRPQSRHALFSHAIAALGADQAALALESLNKTLEIAPDWREAHLLRAQIRVQNDDAEQGLADLKTSVETYPDDTELRMGYARLLISADRPDEAREQFELIAETNPDDGEALFALGVLAMEAEQREQAKQYYQKVLELGHRVLDVYFEMGRAEELDANYQSAQEWYERITDGERYISAQVRAAAMAAKLGDMDEMALRLSELRRENPDNSVQLYISQADILREEEQHESAVAVLSSALQEFPDNHDLLYSRALAAERVDDLVMLEDDLRQILASDPDNGHALNALGYTLADRTDRYQEALELLQRAIEILPDDPAVLDSMGWIKYRLGDNQAALEYLRKAFEINQDPEIVSHYSEVLWETDQREQARKIWQEAFEKAPENRFLLRLQDRFQP